MKSVIFQDHNGHALLDSPVKLLNFDPAEDDVRAEVLAGLSQPQKTLPCKLFYDEKGSQLFDTICDLPEYYPTRTELAIMRQHGREMANAIGSRALVVEYGSGSSLKTRILLDHLPDAAGYVPIDISREHLLKTAVALGRHYPDIPIRPVCADYTRRFWLPDFKDQAPLNVVAYFPGSTIGNFEPEQALAFLKSIRATCGPRSGLLIGVDLKKDPAVIHRAYNDAAGVTSQFNLNMLRRINLELQSNFDLSGFVHYAFYNASKGRIEMHLISRRHQQVNLGQGMIVSFEEGESIHTESSHKFTLERFNQIAAAAGYHRQQVWTDSNHFFSVQLFTSETDNGRNVDSN